MRIAAIRLLSATILSAFAAGAFAQSLEAAHSRARVARVKGDQAGRAIMEAVTAAVCRYLAR